MEEQALAREVGALFGVSAETAQRFLEWVRTDARFAEPAPPGGNMDIGDWAEGIPEPDYPESYTTVGGMTLEEFQAWRDGLVGTSGETSPAPTAE